MAPLSQAELASRIANASPLDKEGRYDMASKVEVKAYFKVEIARLHDINTANTIAIARLEAELQMSWWAKLKRWFSLRLDRIRHPVQRITVDPIVVKQPVKSLAALKQEIERTVGKPAAFAAPYGEKKDSGDSGPEFDADHPEGGKELPLTAKGMVIEEGDAPTVDLSAHTELIKAAMHKNAKNANKGPSEVV